MKSFFFQTSVADVAIQLRYLVKHLADNAVEHWKLTLMLSVLLASPITFLSTSLISLYQLSSSEDGREPPLKPYWFPYLGDWAGFLFARKPLFEGVRRRFGGLTPVTVKLGPVKAYLLTQTETYGPLLRDTRTCTNKAFAVLVMQQLFGTPDSAMHIYRNDNSGIGASPHQGTSVPSHQRVWHHQHRTLSRFLSGDNLTQMGKRIINNLSEELAKTNSDDPIDSGDWCEVDDFFKWWTRKLFAASITALCGPHLVRLSPSFVDDFWVYMENWPAISKFYPHFMASQAYQSRRKILNAIKKWHAYARQHSDYRKNQPSDPGWDEYWGSTLLKVRQEWCQDTGSMDDDAMASEDLALITASSANAIPMAFWNILEIYNDEDLFNRVSEELKTYGKLEEAGDRTNSLPLRFNIHGIMSSAILQSIYAEALRIRVSLMHNRSPTRGDYKLGPFALRNGGLVCISTNLAHNDEGAWGSERTKKPLGQFWAERFLVKEAKEGGSEQVRFSTDGLDGAWIPYGGGSLICPGRHLSKQEIIGSVAVFASYFDLKLQKGLPSMDDNFFGLGTQPPAEPTPVMLRRKIGMIEG